jgi:GNAT superfamily N-acetyltransferase
MSEEFSRRLKAACAPRRAKPEDARQLTQLLTAAFLNDPVMDWVARPGPRRASGLTALFSRLLLKRAIPAGEVWMSDDGSACTVWLPPGEPAARPGVIQQLRLLPFYIKVCGFRRLSRGAAIAEAMEEAHPRECHFYLFFMAVDPALQGQGLGASILRATLARIDAAGMPAYLENSNPRNTRLYERAGFVAGKSISPVEAPPLIPMWRAAAVSPKIQVPNPRTLRGQHP